MDMQFAGSTFGLPIDDAYIYVKYIQNLVAGNGFSFNAGETSFGVTSFLFTIVCASIQKSLPWIDPVMICQGVSIVSHLLLLWVAQRMVYELTGNLASSLFAGGTLAFCRSLYFTAPSGLETHFFILVALLTIWMALRCTSKTLVYVGCMGALLFLSRPEGFYFTLTFLFFLVIYPWVFYPGQVWKAWKTHFLMVLVYLWGFALVVAPYFYFVYLHSGHWMPTTYYGKLLNRSTFTLEPWYEKIKSGFFVVTEGYQQLLAQDSSYFTLGLLLVLSVVSFFFFILQCGQRRISPLFFAARMAQFSFFAFPFLYGAVFRSSPLFGGYFVRYLQILMVILHIEGTIGLFYCIQTLSNLFRRQDIRYRTIVFLSFLSLFYVPYLATFDFHQLRTDIKFYQSHVTVNEKVRKRLARWMDENLEPDARIMTSNSGLGVVGTYCNRFVRDEAGLINTDVYPFLKGFSEGFNHWHKIMEYMKAANIQYYTTFPPYGAMTRHSRIVKEFVEPSLKGTKLERLTKIRITQFKTFETYDLWADYEKESEFVDRSDHPGNRQRIELTQWNNQPVVALLATADQADIRQRMIFPSQAHFRSRIGIDSQQDFGDQDKIRIEIKVHYGGVTDTVFSQEYPLQGYSPQQPLFEIDADVSKYSDKFAFFLYGARCEGPGVQEVWLGWITPRLSNKKLLDTH